MNRSILKTNSARRIPSLQKIGNGIFKKAYSDEPQTFNDDEEYMVRVRETKSDTFTQKKDQFEGIISKKSPDKLVKKVQFLDATSNSDKIEQDRLLPRLVSDKTEPILEFRNLLDFVNNTKLADKKIDDHTDNLLTLLSAMPPEIAGAQDFFPTNNNLISKITSSELFVVIFLIILFLIMVFKLFRYEISPSISVPQLTSSEIFVLMGKNIKRLLKNLSQFEGYSRKTMN